MFSFVIYFMWYRVMFVVRGVACWLLITMMYVCSLVVAFAGIQVSIEDTTIEGGSPVRVVAHVSQSVGDIDYAWYIDGVSLEGVSTQGLDLAWEKYVALFPEDGLLLQDETVTRTLVVAATDNLGTNTGTAELSIIYPEELECGDALVTQNEECDDGNSENGDGCSSTCLCEGMCLSLLNSGL